MKDATITTLKIMQEAVVLTGEALTGRYAPVTPMTGKFLPEGKSWCQYARAHGSYIPVSSPCTLDFPHSHIVTEVER